MYLITIVIIMIMPEDTQQQQDYRKQIEANQLAYRLYLREKSGGSVNPSGETPMVRKYFSEYKSNESMARNELQKMNLAQEQFMTTRQGVTSIPQQKQVGVQIFNDRSPAMFYPAYPLQNQKPSLQDFSAPPSNALTRAFAQGPTQTTSLTQLNQNVLGGYSSQFTIPNQESLPKPDTMTYILSPKGYQGFTTKTGQTLQNVQTGKILEQYKISPMETSKRNLLITGGFIQESKSPTEFLIPDKNYIQAIYPPEKLMTTRRGATLIPNEVDISSTVSPAYISKGDLPEVATFSDIFKASFMEVGFGKTGEKLLSFQSVPGIEASRISAKDVQNYLGTRTGIVGLPARVSSYLIPVNPVQAEIVLGSAMLYPYLPPAIRIGTGLGLGGYSGYEAAFNTKLPYEQRIALGLVSAVSFYGAYQEAKPYIEGFTYKYYKDYAPVQSIKIDGKDYQAIAGLKDYGLKDNQIALIQQGDKYTGNVPAFKSTAYGFSKEYQSEYIGKYVDVSHSGFGNIKPNQLVPILPGEKGYGLFGTPEDLTSGLTQTRVTRLGATGIESSDLFAFPEAGSKLSFGTGSSYILRFQKSLVTSTGTPGTFKAFGQPTGELEVTALGQFQSGPVIGRTVIGGRGVKIFDSKLISSQLPTSVSSNVIGTSTSLSSGSLNIIPKSSMISVASTSAISKSFGSFSFSSSVPSSKTLFSPSFASMSISKSNSISPGISGGNISSGGSGRSSRGRSSGGSSTSFPSSDSVSDISNNINKIISNPSVISNRTISNFTNFSSIKSPTSSLISMGGFMSPLGPRTRGGKNGFSIDMKSFGYKKIKPSFSAVTLDLRGTLPKPISIGGMDLGIMPNQLRLIPLGFGGKRKSRKSGKSKKKKR
jgi:hypothetical protein